MYSGFKPILFLLLLTGIWLFGSLQVAVSQNAPVTTAATISGAQPGQQINVPVTVTGFSNIGSITLHLRYDYSKLHYTQCVSNPLLVGNFAAGDLDMGNGYHEIVIGWYSTAGVSLPNGTWILNIGFTYVAGSSVLHWNDDGPSCLYTDVLGTELTDTPSGTYYIDGRVCGVQASPGPINGSNVVCQGQTSVVYSIAPMSNVTGYLWSVPSGAVISGGSNTNSITVNYSTSAVSGNVTVNGVNECGNSPISTLAVTVNYLPVANAGNDTIVGYGSAILLHAANGGTGSISYHWSPENLLVNPNVQNPQTVQLTSTTIFNLEVTSSGSSCSNSDHVTVTISGGSLSINPTAVPGNICRSNLSQLFANAGGGTGNYNYSWTCTPAGNPAWTSNLPNPIVSPDSSKQYHLTVNDGFAVSSGSTPLIVNQLPTAIISGGDSLCDDGSVTVLRIDLTGIPPWSFTYSDGLNSTTINDQGTTPFLFSVSNPGLYVILDVTDENCHGTTSGAAQVVVYPIPSSPVISFSGTTLISSAPNGNQWYRDMQIIPGATDQYYSPVENGTYYDIVTLHGCSSDSSNNIDVIISNSQTHMSSAFQIYPNPAKDYFYIRSTTPLEREVKLTFFSNDGIPIKECEVSSELEPNEYLIDVRNLSPGFYFLMIYNGDKGVIQKLVIL